MSLNAVFKSKTADKVLAPVREKLLDLMPEKATVWEVGCGTGDLLFRGAEKISRGVGFDVDNGMIEYAQKKKAGLNLSHLEFIPEDVSKTEYLLQQDFDVATATLCLHEMKRDTAVSVLMRMAENSRTILIADYSKPLSPFAVISIELDEMISGHYGRFREYRKAGYMTSLLESAKLTPGNVLRSPIDGIDIWIISV